MRDKSIVIVGGGLSGLAAGIYARASGFHTTVIEHNLALGGVCTSWRRGKYVVDGCIQWLTGGPFDKLYGELGLPVRLELRPIDELLRYRHAKAGIDLSFRRDLDGVARDLIALAPSDAEEISRLMQSASTLTSIEPSIDAPELGDMQEALARVWDSRRAFGAFVHHRLPIETFLEKNIASPMLRKVLASLVPPGAPAIFLVFMLGYLGRGWLTRPIGGSGRFRDALADAYRELGGEVMLHSTVDEVLVDDGHARGVRLDDGTIVRSDVVISTASTPETILRLLGGRFGADDLRRRLREWKTFDPIAIVSFGIGARLEGVPAAMIVDDVEPFEVGGRANDRLHVRVHDDEKGARSVVQAILSTDYEWWATRGSGYIAAKEELADRVLVRLEEHLPRLGRSMEFSDVATPLTFFRNARSWRGAYEGFLPRADSFFGHVSKTLPGLGAFYMAGQWLEPGGGVPVALMSGRQAVQLVCNDLERPFVRPH